jgi:2-methylcitrate dehydratase PrpD
MKTIITLLTTTMLVAGASSAMAFDRQATDDALSYAISQQQASRGFGGAAASVRAPTNAFASAQPGRVHMNRLQAVAPTGGRDFQLQGRGLGE